MNINSTRFQAKSDLSLDEMRALINKNLPSDIEIQKIIKVSRTFSPKRHVGKREYIYLLPTFLLKPKTGKFTPGAGLEEYSGDLKYRIPVELHEKVKTLWQQFEGTRRFHNYSKGIKARSSESQRKIYETTCEQLVYKGDIEFIRFKLVGMSFLYNQIRKMVGTVIEITRENKEISFFENTFLSNKLNLPLAPGEGLYLRRLTFEGYNRKTGQNGVKIGADDEVKN